MKRSKLIEKVSFLFLFSLLQACAVPQPVSRLAPLEDNYEWLNGTENLYFSTKDQLEVELQYIRSTPAYLLFEVGVRNLTDKTVLLDPTKFSMLPLMNDSLSANGLAVFAVNPENQLLELDIQSNREVAEQTNEAGMELLSQGLNLASDIASIGQEKNAEEVEQEELERQQRRENYEVSQAESDIRLQSLDDRRHFWANRTLRKTSLKPGYEIRGTVFFPRNNKVTFLEIKINLGENEFAAKYRQWLYK